MFQSFGAQFGNSSAKTNLKVGGEDLELWKTHFIHYLATCCSFTLSAANLLHLLALFSFSFKVAQIWTWNLMTAAESTAKAVASPRPSSASHHLRLYPRTATASTARCSEGRTLPASRPQPAQPESTLSKCRLCDCQPRGAGRLKKEGKSRGNVTLKDAVSLPQGNEENSRMMETSLMNFRFLNWIKHLS